MGKILVVGRAEREVEADICAIKLELSIKRKTSSDASRVSSELCERILCDLGKLGITPENMELTWDSIEKRGGFRDEEPYYESRKSIWLHLENNMSLVNDIRSIIENGYDDISFSTLYRVSNEAFLNKIVLKDAIEDSRKKAELLAESMGTRIIGIETANLSGDNDVYDLTKDEEDNEPEVYYMTRNTKSERLSDKLKPNNIPIRQEVKIVWLTEQ